MRRRVFAVMAAVLLVAGQAGSTLAAVWSGSGGGGLAASAPIDKGLVEALSAGSADYFVVEFTAKADLRGAARIKDHAQRGKAVVATLQTNAAKSQAGGVALARKAGAEATSYWLYNVLVVHGDAKLAQQFAKLRGVAAVHAPKIYPLVKPVDARAAILQAAGDPEWGVEKIRAPEAWESGVLGQGVVVANLDTGVQFDHPALVGQYRGNNGDNTFTHDYNWWDPTGACGDEPCDDVGHGTHTMGTMVGGDGPGPFTPDIGVAPGARWIAAKGCEPFGCTDTALLSAGQWILAPTDLNGENADPTKRPDIVNNSWGGGPGDPFYLATVTAWRAAGIIPVFSSGNPGPFCGEGGSPGDFLESFSVGATDDEDNIADFSGRGPSAFGKINPDVSAPGVNVVSSVPGDGYEAFDGTSMAAPHTSGAIALILSAEPTLLGDINNYGVTTDTLRGTAVDRLDDSCGGAEDGDPNNVYGDGRIDAKAAVDLVATGGTLSGRVTDIDTDDPIPGATITASDGEREFVAIADSNGEYSLFLAAGSYLVTAQAFGYAPGIASGVEIVTDETTDQDFELDALPRFNVSGVVTASEDGSAIDGALVKALGTPVPAATTDAAGAYTLELPIGDYTLRASAGGCTEQGFADISLVDEDITQDFSLFRKLDDFGHGCRAIPFAWVDAQGQSGLYGDEFAGRLRLPFEFEFYGESYSQVFLSDNGYVNFLGPDQFNSFPSAIPSESIPNAAIYPFWQDLAVDAQAAIDYQTVGTAPNRAFVIEFSQVQVFGSSTHISFEIKLWENGSIDMLYGPNPANPGDGRNAGIGIENAAGNDALQFSFLEDVLDPNTAFRYEHVPSGLIHGVVTDANDDEPIAGAVVTATPGGRTTTTADDGSYSLRLRPGSYDVEASAQNYVSSSAPATVVDEGDLEINFVLDAAVGNVDPTEVSATVEFGDTADVDVTLSNTGTGPMTWEARERDQGATLPDLPPATVTQVRQPTWGPQPGPAGFPKIVINDTVPGDGAGSAILSTIIEDPAGDSLDSNDIIAVRGGSDGQTVASLALDFAPSTPMNEIGGYMFLDTDQDPSTGLPAEGNFGLPTQDVGMEYFLDLFLAVSDGIVFVVDAETFDLVAEVGATVEDHSILFDIPLEVIGGDDGFINTALVVGLFGPSDWAPDEGHGTIEPFVDAPWLAAEPESGEIEPGDSQVVTLHLGGETLAPGEYHAQVIFVTNAPKQTMLPVDVTLTVELPPEFGAITGTVTDAHSEEPLGGVSVAVHAEWQGSPLELTATTGDDGTYTIVGPSGTWPADFSLDGYVTASHDVTISEGVTTSGVDAVLHRDQSHAQLDGGPLTFFLTPGRTQDATLTLSNPGGHEDLTFSIGEVNLDVGSAAVEGVTGGRKLPAATNPNKRTTFGLTGRPPLEVPPAIQADGDVLASWNAGLALPWGVAYTGDVWLSDPIDLINAQFTTGGSRIADFPNPTNGEWGADMAFDAGRGLIWQVNVGGDNGLYGFNPSDGSVEQVITGEPWSDISQRGVAYDQAADVFYVGGWNEGIVYRVAGPSHPTPGETLGQCNPADPNISGLAWNGSFGMLWEATNSETDTIYLIDPASCDTVRAIDHPDGGGGGGAGIELDVVGNLWLSGQNSGNAYLVESGLPNFSDVPWLSVDPTEGTVGPDDSAALTVSVDSTGLTPGVYRAIVVVQTNDPDNSNIQVPAVLVVPNFQQGVNAGGNAYVDPITGALYASDRAFTTGGFGYVGGSARSTPQGIEGTDRDPLYQDLRQGMSAYQFAVPNGVYRVDLSFAEIQLQKAGARVFSVSLEGAAVVSNLDVFAAAGGRRVAYDLSYVVEVTDGVLDVSFAAQRGDQPIVNGILVTELPPGSPE
ncbi:MAG TPA: carboxypeptidase regulatory-like domain-containing protein [Candidatus Limnocylindrales bacterium]|nr:carboxypeptidase regulatory-like domain-containing protein [Candidatus Limnocylindrales bacterium]